MRLLCYNPAAIAICQGPVPKALLLEPVSRKALLAAAAALGSNRLLPVLVPVAPGVAAADVTALVRDLRARGAECAILISAGPEADVTAWLDAGADDVLSPGIGADELMARLRAILRRLHGVSSGEIRIGALTLYGDGRHPVLAGAALRLSPREYDILHYLALSAGRVVSKSAIYDALYSLSDSPPFEKIIDVYICRLRNKISAAACAQAPVIETVSGRGYRLIAGTARLAEPAPAEAFA